MRLVALRPRSANGASFFGIIEQIVWYNMVHSGFGPFVRWRARRRGVLGVGGTIRPRRYTRRRDGYLARDLLDSPPAPPMMAAGGSPAPYIEDFSLDAGGWEGRKIPLERVVGSVPGRSAVRSASPCESRQQLPRAAVGQSRRLRSHYEALHTGHRGWNDGSLT